MQCAVSVREMWKCVIQWCIRSKSYWFLFETFWSLWNDAVSRKQHEVVVHDACDVGKIRSWNQLGIEWVWIIDGARHVSMRKWKWDQEIKIGVCTFVRYREVCYPNNRIGKNDKATRFLNALAEDRKLIIGCIIFLKKMKFWTHSTVFWSNMRMQQ